MSYGKLKFKSLYGGIMLLALLYGSCNSSGRSNQEEDTLASAGKTDAKTEEETGFEEIFDGKSLNGWEGDSTYWRVENGSLVGEVTPSTPLENNTFIIWQGGQPADFELKGEFRISLEGNSGINYRSIALDNIPYGLKGYQADIDGKNRYTGQNYEERGRTTLAYRGEEVTIHAAQDGSEGSLRDHVKNNAWTERTITGALGDQDSLGSLIKREDWNAFHLIVNDNRMQHYVNGILMSDVTDKDSINRKLEGMLGVQVHVGPPMKAEYRNLRLKQL